MKHFEIITIEHRNVGVDIKVDYDRGELSLVERWGTEWRPKSWMFSGRTVDYLNSWQVILEAMQKAVKEGKRLLEQDLAKNTEIKVDKIAAVLVEDAKRKK